MNSENKKMLEKILVIGKGFLGTSICNCASNIGIEAIGTNFSSSINYVDVSNINSLEKIASKIKPNLIINCAGVTNVDEIEKNSSLAYAVNAYGAKNVAEIAHYKKIKLIHISTDSVFDGTKKLYSEDDEPNPINEYAKSKKMGEDLIKSISDNYVIARTNFYGYNKVEKFLFNWILNNLKEHKYFNGFTDVFFIPLQVDNLSSMIIELGSKDFTGIINLSSNTILSKYKFASLIANELGFEKNLIYKSSIKDSSLIAKRPLNTSLSNLKAKKILTTSSIELVDWLKNFNKSFVEKY